MSLFWKEEFIKEFKSQNDKLVSSLYWKGSEEDILSQLTEAFNLNAELILTDILPDELPNETPSQLFDFYIKRFNYCPPHFSLQSEYTLDTKKDKLLVYDKNFKGTLSKSYIKSTLLNQFSETNDFTVQTFNHDYDSLNKLNKNISGIDRLILVSDCPNLTNYVVCASINYKFKLNIYPRLKNSSRLNGLGLTVCTNDIEKERKSIRSIFNTLMLENTTIKVHQNNAIELLKINSVDNYYKLFENPIVNYYFSSLHRHDIKCFLWKPALPFPDYQNRFNRRITHSLLSSKNIPDEDLHNTSAYCYLSQLVLSYANNYSQCFDEIEREIVYLLKYYYKEKQFLFDKVFLNLINFVDSKVNAINSIIGECFLIVSFDKKIESDKNFYLNKAIFYLDLDFSNGSTKYSHYELYIELINKLKNNNVNSSCDIPFRIKPYITKLHNIKEIYTSYKPNVYESMWFLKNTLRANGYFNFLMKDNISKIQKNELICDFFNKCCDNTCMNHLSLIINNSIFEKFNDSSVDFDSKILAIHLYKKLYKKSVDSFILENNNLSTIKSDSRFMLLSTLSKDYFKNTDSSWIHNNIMQEDFHKMLKPNNHLFNFCLYKLAHTVMHSEFSSLLKLSESSNPLHYYLETQFA